MKYSDLFIHFLLTVLVLIQSNAIFAIGDGEDPILVVKGSDKGVFEDWNMWFNGSGSSVYRLCTLWDGPVGGTASTELFKMRGSIRNLKVGEQLQFYKASTNANVNGSDEHSAVTSTIGDGLFETVYNYPGGGYTKRDKAPILSELPPSAFANAKLTRTATGALLLIDGIPSAHCGEESLYFNSTTPTIRITFSNEELDAWDKIEKTVTHSGPGMDGNGTYSYSVTVTAKLPDEDGKVEVELVNFNNWIPEGNVKDPKKTGNTMRIKAKVIAKEGDNKSKDAIFTFTLTNISTEPGVCINGPNAEGFDLKFTEEDNPQVDLAISEDKIQTKDYVKEIEVVVSSFDYGAHAELLVSAEDRGGKKLKVILQGKDRSSIALPKAELGGNIADAWREKESVEGLSDDWDGAELSGQTAKGDGLDLYAKYRGLLTIDKSATPEHIRLPAKEKVHFVIDKSNKFDFERWYASSGIRAYRVDEQTSRKKQVDFNSSSASRNGGKYAVEIEIINGMKEKDPLPLTEDEIKAGKEPGNDPLQYGYTVGDTPKETERCRVFPDRIQAMLVRVITKMNKALANPDAPENADEIAVLKSLGKSFESIRERLKAIDENEIKVLTDMMVKLTAIHEMAHACGVDGHLNEFGKEDEELLRTPSCPMNYLFTKERRLFILYRKLEGEGKFCSNPPDNCWKQLNVK